MLDEKSLEERLQHLHVLVAAASEGIVGTIAAALVNGEGHLRGMAVSRDLAWNWAVSAVTSGNRDLAGR